MSNYDSYDTLFFTFRIELSYILFSRARKHGFFLCLSGNSIYCFTDGDGIFRLSKQLDHENQDVVGEKCVRNSKFEL